MNNVWTSYIVFSALAASALGLFIWNRMKRKFVKVGRVAKLFFYPVKSLKGIEVTKGYCTKLGFQVDGVLDRSFMLIDAEGVLISQRQEPSLVLLTPKIKESNLIIHAPNIKPLKIKLNQSFSPDNKIINCKVHTDTVGGIDCGDEAASWFQLYLGRKEIRLIFFNPTLTLRKYERKDLFYSKLKKKYPIGFQDLAAFHVMSQASIDDLNSRIEENKVTVLNFRPNILVDNCYAYAEDSWKYMKFQNRAQLVNLILTTRCTLTTNDPETGVLTQKEPLISLRKYRITSDPALKHILGSIPCLGIGCALVSPGEIKVNDDIFAVVGKQPEMSEKAL